MATRKKKKAKKRKKKAVSKKNSTSTYRPPAEPTVADKILVVRLVDSNAVVAFVGSSEKTMKRLQPLEGSEQFEFGFGYEGSGADSLAMAILTATLGADVAASFSADLVRDVLSVQDKAQWGITIADLKAWLAPKLQHEWTTNGRCKLCGQYRRPDHKDGPCPARFKA